MMPESIQLYFVLGAPGSGKTTISRNLSTRNPQISHYSMGDLLRKRKELAKTLENSQYAPTAIIQEIMEEIFRNPKNPIMLMDGFPRNEEQLLLFEQMESRKFLTKVIEIEVEEEISLQRLHKRNERIEDLDLKKNQNRLQEYYKEIEKIRTFYQNQRIFEQMNGNADIETVADALEKQIFG